ncbi:MAG: UDP-N-acetylglucosamine--LPS N-acetylglucosamine transferase [Deltaproteobacteria bacterium]
MNGLSRSRLKICVVSSIGGHLDEAVQILPVLEAHDWFFVVNAEGEIPARLKGRTERIVHSERDLKLLVNFWEAARILRARRPDVILSFGAGPAVPFAIVGKMMGMKIVFVETFAAVTRPTLTGRILYRLADLFLYQWESLAPIYPRGIYGGPVF